MSSTSQQTEQTLHNHLQAAEQGDVDAIVADYAEDAVIFTPDGILRGRDEIRSLFEELVADFPPGSTVEMKQQIVDGELAYLVWAGASEKLDIPLATDTLIVRDGKIVMQTFTAQMEVKTRA